MGVTLGVRGRPGNGATVNSNGVIVYLAVCETWATTGLEPRPFLRVQSEHFIAYTCRTCIMDSYMASVLNRSL